MAERAVLGLGSNVGRREAQLHEAVARLKRVQGIEVVALSAIYESPPFEVAIQQGDFLNQVVVVLTGLEARPLLSACQGIEGSLGRPRQHPWGAPRTIDIDLITWGERVTDLPGLVLPHPRYTRRRFVLLPLAEVVPDFRDPDTGYTVQQLLDECPDTTVVSLWGDLSEAHE